MPDQLLISKFCLKWVLIQMREIPTFISSCSLISTPSPPLYILTWFKCPSTNGRQTKPSFSRNKFKLLYGFIGFCSLGSLDGAHFLQKMSLQIWTMSAQEAFTTNWFLNQAQGYRHHFKQGKHLQKKDDLNHCLYWARRKEGWARWFDRTSPYGRAGQSKRETWAGRI